MTRLKSSKDFRRKPAGGRLRARILLACEGETEVDYFQSVGLDWHISVAPIRRACGLSPLKLVEEAHAAALADRDFDALIAVFDCDTHSCFNDAVKFVKSNKVVKGRPFHAYQSTPCFEYWLLLHYGLTTTSFKDCDDVIKRLKQHMPGYKKPTPDLFSILADRFSDARGHARKCRAAHAATGGTDPITRIDELFDFLEGLKG